MRGLFQEGERLFDLRDRIVVWLVEPSQGALDRGCGRRAPTTGARYQAGFVGQPGGVSTRQDRQDGLTASRSCVRIRARECRS